MDDNDKAPKVALVNRQFAVKVFGSVDKAIGGHFKFWGGERAEVVGVVEDGKYRTLTEDQMPAMFFSFLQQQTSRALLLVRSDRDPQELTAALGAHSARAGFGIASSISGPGPGDELRVVRRARGHRGSGRAGVARRDARGDGHLWHGFLFGEQTPARAGNPRSAGCEPATGAAHLAGKGFPAAGYRAPLLESAWECWQHGSVVNRVPGDTERSNGAGRRVSDDAAAGDVGVMDPRTPCSRSRPAGTRFVTKSDLSGSLNQIRPTSASRTSRASSRSPCRWPVALSRSSPASLPRTCFADRCSCAAHPSDSQRCWRAASAPRRSEQVDC